MTLLKPLPWIALLASFAASQEKVVSKTFTVHSGYPDTVVTLHQYDPDGFLVRRISRDTLVQEWDDQGRYIGLRNLGDTAYIEKTTWFSADSAQRRIPTFEEPFGERWFGRKKNCWCADSIYLYKDIHTLMAKMVFTFDSHGQMTRQEVLYLLPDPDFLDTSNIYEHTYDQDGRLVTTHAANLESGLPRESTTTYEYADLSTLVVERPGLRVKLRRAPWPRVGSFIPGFDILGRSRPAAQIQAFPATAPRSH